MLLKKVIKGHVSRSVIGPLPSILHFAYTGIIWNQLKVHLLYLFEFILW
jgi:hypothetical protein